MCSDLIPIFGKKVGLLIIPPSVYTVTIRDGIHKLLQKTTGQMLINVKVRTYNEARGYPELGQP